MKCPCGFNEKPDNLPKLRAHLETCQTSGRLPKPKSKNGYIIVWRNGEFAITDKKDKKETEFNAELPKGKTPQITKKVGLPSYTPAESLLSPNKNPVKRKKKEEK